MKVGDPCARPTEELAQSITQPLLCLFAFMMFLYVKLHLCPDVTESTETIQKDPLWSNLIFTLTQGRESYRALDIVLGRPG